MHPDRLNYMIEREGFGIGAAKWWWLPCVVSDVLALDGGETSETLCAKLEQARACHGLSVIHVPVYAGPDPLGDMGTHGRWNVGN